MKRIIPLSLIMSLSSVLNITAQSKLTIEQIMQDPKTWIGTSPSNIFWSENGDEVYFDWNPEMNPGDSLYYITMSDPNPKKVSPADRRGLPERRGKYDRERERKVYIKNGDIFLFDLNSKTETQITNTVERVSSVSFNFDNTSILFEMNKNLFSWQIETGYVTQLTDFTRGKEKSDPKQTPQDKWLQDDQKRLISVLEERKERNDLRSEINKSNEPAKPKKIYIGSKSVSNIQPSPDGNFITYTLIVRAKGKGTEVADYITESGYTTNKRTRANVGTELSLREVWIYNIENDTVYQVITDQLEGIKDFPDYYADYDKYKDAKPKVREVYTNSPIWSEDGKNALISFLSRDNKDRWISLLNLTDGTSKLLDRQRDEAWIAGPGIGWSSQREMGWMPDHGSIWFKSETSGYSHLYTVDITSGKKKALTSGEFEVYNTRLSRYKDKWYFEANMDHPGKRDFYRMPLDGGKPVKITNLPGRNDVKMSLDESMLAIRNSFANQPWEFYLMKNEKGAQPVQITSSLTQDFQSYDWRVPEFVTFKARDKAEVHARLYKPENPPPDGPAVIFVHGAGYLQNAHQWWSSYFREYMFHNFLTDNGYTVLDIDYRASAGYGRDWRTAIYRHMGGWDLNDQVDGADYLVEEHGIAADKIGIYGGSYGGFITLMALFTQPDVFAAGAALRSVTDWAHYNNGYTSNILNTPVQDSLAYVRSSPIYYAEGLNKPLLICHGMVDTNVHFQDVVRLAQRFIELGKEDWEMAVYPVENHGFVEPSSWTDEYTRIYKLFEENLK